MEISSHTQVIRFFDLHNSLHWIATNNNNAIRENKLCKPREHFAFLENGMCYSEVKLQSGGTNCKIEGTNCKPTERMYLHPFSKLMFTMYMYDIVMTS